MDTIYLNGGGWGAESGWTCTSVHTLLVLLAICRTPNSPKPALKNTSLKLRDIGADGKFIGIGACVVTVKSVVDLMR